jgi:hypothetical protein
MKKILMVVVAVLVVLPANAIAGGFCCQLNTGVSEGLGGGTSSGKLQLRFDASYSRMEGYFEGDSDVSLTEVMADPRFKVMGGVVPESMDMTRLTLSGSYAVTDRFRVFVSVPWVINDMTMRMYMPAAGMWMKMRMKEVSDLGDVTVSGMYRVYQDRDIMPLTVLSVGVGLKTPTGSYGLMDNGTRIHAHMQPGTGSWDPILSVAFVKMFSSAFLVRADANWQITTENPLGYEYGDTVAVNGHLDYNALDFLNLSLGLGYFHSDQADDRRNNYLGNQSQRLTDYTGYTGEDSVWVSPGVQILPFGGASIDVSVQVPVYKYSPDIQQLTDYRVLAGLSYAF